MTHTLRKDHLQCCILKSPKLLIRKNGRKKSKNRDPAMNVTSHTCYLLFPKNHACEWGRVEQGYIDDLLQFSGYHCKCNIPSPFLARVFIFSPSFVIETVYKKIHLVQGSKAVNGLVNHYHGQFGEYKTKNN